jgi:hypothetical protein
MDYEVEVDQIAGHVVVRVEGVFKGPKLLMDGAPPKAGAKKGTFLLPTQNGGEVSARLIPSFTHIAPALEIDGVRIEVSPKLSPGWYVLIALPMGLVAVGGLLGGLCGGVGMAANQVIARSTLATPVKILLMLMIIGGVTILWIGMGTLFSVLTS